LHQIDQRRTVQKCYRNKTVVGLICLARGDNISQKSDLKLISNIVCFIYNRLFPTNIFANIHTPINYHQPEESFYKELELLSRFSSAMCAGALREINKDGKSLSTIFGWNLHYKESWPSDWDIDNFEEVPEIKEAVFNRIPVALNSIDTIDGGFFGRPEQALIRSAVFSPVLVGKETFGVLSFAQHIPYEYTEQEINGFLSIANSVGVSIQNFRQASIENEELGIGVRNATVFTALEVAQAARHTAKGVIDTVNVHLAALMLYAKNKSLPDLGQSLTELSSHVFTITKALDDIKAASKPPKNELVSYGLQAIWEEARRQLLGKLNSSKINCRWDGPDVAVLCYPDQIRQLFLNLIINSIDAYARGGASGKRNIVLRCDAAPNSNHIKLTYVDNAGGLDVQALQPFRKDNVDLTQLVFEKDVTTKGEEGSGWGLHICRRVMARHVGSIDLIDYRRGMTFVIQIPKELAH
jgi:hypothetical protein